jgi:methionyl-tRNA synthetase
MLSPFMPARAAELWSQLGGPGSLTDQRLGELMALDCAGWRVRKGEALFPKNS